MFFFFTVCVCVYFQFNIPQNQITKYIFKKVLINAIQITYLTHIWFFADFAFFFDRRFFRQEIYLIIFEIIKHVVVSRPNSCEIISIKRRVDCFNDNMHHRAFRIKIMTTVKLNKFNIKNYVVTTDFFFL